ncbi:uncharacterized protein [Antedon mediterranea]|uniref:uncharacterized protein n=1 Tax=Antedon mediterranea TaxID=105859 RepID=UPI003AF433D7
MRISKYTAVAVFCLLSLTRQQTEGREDEGNDGNRVWNFFFGDKEYRPQDSCKGKQMTCETRNASVVYTHWGRTDCTSDSSDIVYTGYVGGGHYSHHGGGTDPLCLPDVPEYNDDLKSTTGSRTNLYGAEYETTSYSPLNDMHDHDVICAVCLAQGRSTSMMIPAKRTCPGGWTKEYEGLLMGSHHTHSGGHDYLCVDGTPQARHGSLADQNGFLLYPVVGICGSLPCPPYTNDAQLPCVVCTW